MINKSKGVTLIVICSKCGESVKIFITKEQLKAIMKGFKNSTNSEKKYLLKY